MHRNYSFPTRGSTNHVYRKNSNQLIMPPYLSLFINLEWSCTAFLWILYIISILHRLSFAMTKKQKAIKPSLRLEKELVETLFYRFCLLRVLNQDWILVFGRKERRRTRLLNQLRKGAVVIKSSLPKIKDVNVIDKYSRVVFPVSFILFNVMYWCFYVLEVWSDPIYNLS